MAKVKFITYDGKESVVFLSNGTSVMQGAIDNMVGGIVGECGGACSCATCHCYVDESWCEKVGSAGGLERAILAVSKHKKPNSRLSCQITVSDELDGLVIHLPRDQGL
ncbi:MAG: 2Fe-2S iron-sulfur cluster-binding protein [bacterium]